MPQPVQVRLLFPVRSPWLCCGVSKGVRQARAHRTLGLKIFRRMGLSETPLFTPVTLSVSFWISCRISSKSVKRLPAARCCQWVQSACCGLTCPELWDGTWHVQELAPLLHGSLACLLDLQGQLQYPGLTS